MFKFEFARNYLLFIVFAVLYQPGWTQVTGLWKTIGDVDGKEKSIVEIYEEDGKLHGKVVKILPASAYTICENCDGELKNKPITGMVILKDLTKTSDGGEDGEVMDPGSGKVYSCYIKLESPDKLKLRGYIGVRAIGRTQYWHRVQSLQ